MTTATRQIADHEITLNVGRRYLASRPMLDRPITHGLRMTVTIQEMDGNLPVWTRRMSFDHANKFINEFNNGDSSWDGRLWE